MSLTRYTYVPRIYLHNAIFNNMTRQGHDISPLFFPTTLKVIHPKYYKHLKKGAHQSHLGRQKMGWFLAD